MLSLVICGWKLESMNLATRFAIALLTLGCITVSRTQNLVVFGDSLSDNGFGAEVIQQVLRTSEIYPAKPYYQGRYSDGPTWVEIVATTLNAEMKNYACGGASSGATPATSNPILPPFGGLTQPTPYQAPDFQQQMSYYFAANGNVSDANDVFVVEFGSNDVLQIVFGNNATIDSVLSEIRSGVQTLYEAGARKFVITTNSRIFAPFFSTEMELRSSQALSLELFTEAISFSQELPLLFPGSSARLFDFGGALVEVYGNATQLGITNTSSCYVAALTPLGQTSIRSESFQSGDLCQDPTRHAFFDTVHPSSTVHAGIARAFLRDIAPFFWGSSRSSAPVAAASNG